MLRTAVVLSLGMSLWPVGNMVQANIVSGETTGATANYHVTDVTGEGSIFTDYDNVIVNHNEDTYQAFCPALSFAAVSYNNTSYGISNQQNVSSLLSQSKSNAVAMKYYDAATDSYKCKVIATSSHLGTSDFSSYLAKTVFDSPKLQKELHALMKSGDKAALKSWMNKYLPHIYLVTVDQKKLADINKALTTESHVDYTDNSLDIDDDMADDKEVDALMDIEAANQVTYSEKQYTYDNATVKSGDVWKPMDRTLTTTSTLNGTFSLPKYWVTGKSDTEEASDSSDPNFNNQSGDTSHTYQGGTSPISDIYDAVTAITIKELVTGTNSVIDMSYANTVTNNAGGTYTGTYTDDNGKEQSVTTASNRYLMADSATLGEGTTFRLGAYGTKDYVGDGIGESTDTVYIHNASQADVSADKTHLYIQLGYVPGISTGASYGAGYVKSPWYDGGGLEVNGALLGIQNGADKFTVTAQTSKADGIYSVYEITPIIGEKDNYFTDDAGNKTGKVWYLKGYTYEDTGEVAESGKTAGDNAMTLQNLWKTHVSSLFDRPEDLHRRHTVSEGQTPKLGKDLDDKENVWGEAWHGRYNSSSDYGRKVGQNYNGMQAGYDKLLNGTYGGGKVYAGMLVTRITGDSNTSTGQGNQDGSGVGVYGSWVGSRGHYVDVVTSALRLCDDYHFTGNTGDGTMGNVYGKWSTWTYGMGLQYGRRNDRENGFWWDPHVSVYMGHMNHKSYTLSNGLGVDNKDYNIFTGRIGITAGKTFGGNRGRIYAGASLAHEFGSGQEVDQFWYAHGSAGTASSTDWDISKRDKAADTGGHDTWMELKAGGDVRLSDSSKFHAEYAKSVGRKDGNDWSISGRLEFAWAGIGGSSDRVKKEQSGQAAKGSMPSYTKAHAPTVVIGAQSEATSTQNTPALSKAAGTAQDSAPVMQLGSSSAGTASVTPTEQNNAAAGTFTPSDGTASVSAGETVPVLTAPQSASALPGMAQNGAQTMPQHTALAGAVPVTAAPDALQESSASNTENLQAETPSAAENAGPADIGNSSGGSSSFAEGSTTVQEGSSGGYQLKGVTVEADRPDWEKELSPGQVSVIYTKDFEGEQKDLPALLDRIPGLFIDHMNGQGHYTTARIRGSTASQVDVYIDGVRMNMNGESAVNLSAIPVDNIERIEVYRGYVPARFTGAPLGGVINIVTKKPNAGRGYVTQGFRSYGGYSSTYEYSMPLGTGSLMATWGRDIWQGDFKFQRPKRAGERPGDNLYRRHANDYQNNDGMVKWQDSHWMIKAQYRDDHEALAHALSGNTWFDFPFFTDGYWRQQLDTKYKEFYVGRQDTWKNLDINWHIAYMDEDKHFFNTGLMAAINTPASQWDPSKLGPQPQLDHNLPGQLWSHYHSKKWDYNLNLAYHLWNSHLIEFNGDIVKERMDTDGDGWNKTQEQLDTQTGVYRTWRKMLPTYHNSEYHFTLQDTMTLNDAGDMKLTVIGRADKVKMQGLWEDIGGKDSHWMYSGGAALQKQLDSHWSVKTSWGTYYRHPNFYEIFGDGMTILQSYFMQQRNRLGYSKGTWEWGSQFDFSLNRQGKMLGADTDTVVTWFQRKSNNQLVLYTPWRGPGVSYYLPSGQMSVHGIELSHHMTWNRLNLALAATWQKGKTTQTVEGYEVSAMSTGNNSFVPEWVVNARLDYTFPGNRFNLFGEYRFNGKEVIQGSSSSSEDLGHTVMSVRDSYAMVDLGAKYQFDNGIKLSAGVNDVFNRGYKVMVSTKYYYGPRVANLYPLPGRMYYATIGYSF